MTYYTDPYRRTSHQQAFPPAFSSYANAGPSTAYPHQNPDSTSSPYSHQNRVSYAVANIYDPRYGYAAPSGHPTPSRSKGTEYLRGLTSSISQLDIGARPGQNAYRPGGTGSGPVTALDEHVLYTSDAPYQAPARATAPDGNVGTYSGPRYSPLSYSNTPQYDKQLPPLPPQTLTAYATACYTDTSALPQLAKSHSSWYAPPPIPPRPASLPSSTYDARLTAAATGLQPTSQVNNDAGPSRYPLTAVNTANTDIGAVRASDHTYRHEVQMLPAEVESRPDIPTTSAFVSSASSSSSSSPFTPAKTFRPSVHPHSKPRLSDEARLRPPAPHTPPRPHSDPVVPLSEPICRVKPKTQAQAKGRGKANSRKHNVGGSRKDPVEMRHERRNDDRDDSEYRPVIDLTQMSSPSEEGSSSSSSSDDETNKQITLKSKVRRKRATSEQPLRPAPQHSSGRPNRVAIPNTAGSPSPASGTAVQCSGFTRTGQPCKRLVKTSAPFLASRDSLSNKALRAEGDGEADVDVVGDRDGDRRSDRVMGRYCKDHAGMICQVGGFYWRGQRGNACIWVDFADYIPTSLGQQTQALLRMTMESKLTDKECPGYLYAYELRDLETPTLAFFKVGRTDNVPRRIGQWTNQCQSKTPTLRDIFPLPSVSSITATAKSTHQSRPRPRPGSESHHSASSLHRSGTLTTSFLPGATTHLNPPSAAMKRWERLVHIELSDRCASHPESQKAFERVREKCVDCGMGHKEIFPLVKIDHDGGRVGAASVGVYEDVVVEVVCRWERFISIITG
ncbi:hypothetical protein IAU59_004379 [Kwoniella sp. CBS 9459]